jgi:acetyltransferase
MIGELKGRACLGSFRGLPAADLDRIADILIKVAAIGIERPEIKEIDMNPVIVSDDTPVAVDALIVLVS